MIGWNEGKRTSNFVIFELDYVGYTQYHRATLYRREGAGIASPVRIVPKIVIHLDQAAASSVILQMSECTVDYTERKPIL